ncbi:hypothetical protein [Bremerella alba]|uniref:Lipoprotein n=1 Tax=Bremerella alba TaxID=980252 RepID=A0A7V9A5F7_9BACT|nr:hypothetical protein [Bremerella alba]MBA2113132.1 hypothetical protein [Bremerella alba]
MNIIRLTLVASLSATLALVAGCGRTTAPGLVPLDVQVLYQDQPVDEAVIIFVGEDGKYANGLTNASGIAAMGTFSPGDGVHPGKYNVGIDKSQLNQEQDPNDPTGDKILSSETIFHIPAKFGDPINSGLTADVQEGGELVVVFELVD